MKAKASSERERRRARRKEQAGRRTDRRDEYDAGGRPEPTTQQPLKSPMPRCQSHSQHRLVLQMVALRVCATPSATRTTICVEWTACVCVCTDLHPSAPICTQVVYRVCCARVACVCASGDWLSRASSLLSSLLSFCRSVVLSFCRCRSVVEDGWGAASSEQGSGRLYYAATCDYS